MKIKTSELTGSALDWAVATALDIECVISPYLQYPNTEMEKIVGYGVYLDPPERDEFGDISFEPSTQWSQGGPIIESEWICPDRLMDGRWLAAKRTATGDAGMYAQLGPTSLIAAMRCYVASKLGSEVDIPEELLNV